MKLFNKIAGNAILLLFLFLANNINAQVTNKWLQDGTHLFISDLPDQDLHFYLYEDGYFSFKTGGEHDYHDDFVGVQPLVYSIGPYDPEPPDKLDAGEPIENTHHSVNIEPTDLSNKVEIVRSWNLVEERMNFFVLMFENKESTAPIDGCIEFHYKKTHSAVNEPDIKDDYNDWVYNYQAGDSEYTSQGLSSKLSWEFDDLAFGEQRFIYIPTECLALFDEKVKTVAVMKVGNQCNVTLPYGDESNGNGEDPMFIYTSVVKAYPHDPNCIVSTCGSAYINYDRNIIYRVYFHNDGNGVAPNISVESNFTNGTIANVELLQASHYCTLAFSSGATSPYSPDVIVEFPNINLPGIGMHVPYLSTIGWVEFKVCFDNFDAASCVYHNADIYFENQPPIPVENKICDGPSQPCNSWSQNIGSCGPVGPGLQSYDPFSHSSGQRVIAPENDLTEFVLYPNPSSDQITVEFPKWFDVEGSTLDIYSLQGKLVKRITGITESALQEINISEFLDGVYLLRAYNEETRVVKSFVKS